jgi:hypothetical protein
LQKIFKYFFVHRKDSPQKPWTKVKRTREEMQATLETIRKITAKSPSNVLKRKNQIEEGEPQD